MIRPDETLGTWAGICGICLALMVLLLVITEQRRRAHRKDIESRRAQSRARTAHLTARIAHAAADPVDRELLHLSGQCTGQCEQPYDQEQTP